MSFYTQVSVSSGESDIPLQPPPPPHLAESPGKKAQKAHQREPSEEKESPRKKVKVVQQTKTSKKETASTKEKKAGESRKKRKVSSKADNEESDGSIILVTSDKTKSKPTRTRKKKPETPSVDPPTSPPSYNWSPLQRSKPWKGFQDELFESARLVTSISSLGEQKNATEEILVCHQRLQLFFVRFLERVDLEGQSRRKTSWVVEAGEALNEHCQYRAVSCIQIHSSRAN
jgi:Tfp pilus tip-associated adhesin PilY1